MISTTPTNNPTNCGLCVGTDPADRATRFFCANEPATAMRAGEFPPAENDGKTYLNIPLNQF